MKGRLGHQPALDGLRGVAILLVFIHHLQPFHGFMFGAGGFLGVDLFFVLSGFLITTLILERQGEGLWPFYRRRALRLLPAAVFFVVIAAAVHAASNPAETRDAVVSGGIVLSYLMNWFDQSMMVPSMSHLWSLAVEEQFYIVWPVVLGLVMSRGLPRRQVVGVMLLVAAAVGVWRFLLFQAGDPDAYFRTDARADALLIGSALAIAGPSLARFSAATASTIGSAAFAVFVAAGLVGAGTWVFLGGYTMVALVAAIVVVAALDPRWTLYGPLSGRAIRSLGRASYSVYLWHYPVIVAVRATDLTGPAAMVVSIAVTAGFVAVSYRYVEQPFLRLKDKLEKKPVAPANVAPDALPA